MEHRFGFFQIALILILFAVFLGVIFILARTHLKTLRKQIRIQASSINAS